MSAYRFCRTDDIGLLVDALNRCWAPYVPDQAPMTPAAFKRAIRDLQVWCSSCMVAVAGRDPIGVLIGARRDAATLVHRIAVHPDHARQGHGRHLLESLASKLAILGPPRIVAEIPEDLAAARGLFTAAEYVAEATLTDHILEDPKGGVRDRPAGFLIPVTLDDLAANAVLPEATACWERSLETLRARKGDLQGLAVASHERIEAYLLYMRSEGAVEIAALRSLIDDGGDRLGQLLSWLAAQDVESVRFPKVHAAEVPTAWLEGLGFRAGRRYDLYATTARAD